MDNNASCSDPLNENCRCFNNAVSRCEQFHRKKADDRQNSWNILSKAFSIHRSNALQSTREEEQTLVSNSTMKPIWHQRKKKRKQQTNETNVDKLMSTICVVIVSFWNFIHESQNITRNKKREIYSCFSLSMNVFCSKTQSLLKMEMSVSTYKKHETEKLRE